MHTSLWFCFSRRGQRAIIFCLSRQRAAHSLLSCFARGQCNAALLSTGKFHIDGTGGFHSCVFLKPRFQKPSIFPPQHRMTRMHQSRDCDCYAHSWREGSELIEARNKSSRPIKSEIPPTLHSSDLIVRAVRTCDTWKHHIQSLIRVQAIYSCIVNGAVGDS